MTPLIAIGILVILGAFFHRIRPGAPFRAVAVLFAALADAADLLPHYLWECGRGLSEIARYFGRQCVHYSRTSREAAR